MTERPSTEAGERLLASSVGWVAPYPDDDGTFIPVVQDAMCESILAIETEAFMDGARASRQNRKEIEPAAGPPAGAERVTRESLAAALRTAAFAMPAKRIEDYDPDDFYRDYADAILAALPEAAVQEPEFLGEPGRVVLDGLPDGSHVPMRKAARLYKALHDAYGEDAEIVVHNNTAQPPPASVEPAHIYPHHGYFCAMKDCPGYVKAASVEAEGLDVEKLAAAIQWEFYDTKDNPLDDRMALRGAIAVRIGYDTGRQATVDEVSAAYRLLEQREA